MRLIVEAVVLDQQEDKVMLNPNTHDYCPICTHYVEEEEMVGVKDLETGAVFALCRYCLDMSFVEQSIARDRIGKVVEND
jgi:hypothetical protein